MCKKKDKMLAWAELPIHDNNPNNRLQLYDGKPITIHEAVSEGTNIEHLLPRSHGGPDRIDNYTIMFVDDNRQRGNTPLSKIYKKMTEVEKSAILERIENSFMSEEKKQYIIEMMTGKNNVNDCAVEEILVKARKKKTLSLSDCAVIAKLDFKELYQKFIVLFGINGELSKRIYEMYSKVIAEADFEGLKISQKNKKFIMRQVNC